MTIQVTVKILYNSLQHTVRLAAGEPIGLLLPALMGALNLPSTDNRGNLIAYYLMHNGRRLQEQETLTSARVQPGDTLIIHNEEMPLAELKPSKAPTISADTSIEVSNAKIIKAITNTPRPIIDTQQKEGLSFLWNNMAQVYNEPSSQNLIEITDFQRMVDKGNLGSPGIPGGGIGTAIGGEYSKSIEVTLEDHRGNRFRARMPNWVAVARLIPTIIVKLKLPAIDAGGNSVTYYLRYSGRRLREQETLAIAGVHNNDTLAIIPEFGYSPTDVDSEVLEPGFQPHLYLPSNIPSGLQLRPLY